MCVYKLTKLGKSSQDVAKQTLPLELYEGVFD